MEVNHRGTTVIVLFLVVNLSTTLVVSESSHTCKAWLVQSIPTDMPHLRRVSGVLSTCNFFPRLVPEKTQLFLSSLISINRKLIIFLMVCSGRFPVVGWKLIPEAGHNSRVLAAESAS